MAAASTPSQASAFPSAVREHAFAEMLSTALAPLGGGWHQRLSAEIQDPRLGGVVGAEFRRQGAATLPFDAAVAVYDYIHATYAVPLVRRVTQRTIKVPLVSKDTLLAWRAQYGASSEASVTPEEVLFWVQYTVVGACRQAYTPTDEARENPLALLWNGDSHQGTFALVASALVLVSFLARMKRLSGG